MARRLLTGRAGAGKTHACLDLLTKALRARERALLLVPTYGQAEHLRHLLLDRSDGLSEHAVRTFEQLAEGVTKLQLRDLVPPPVRDRVAASALAAGVPEGARRAGLRAEFLAAVKELKEQGEDPETAAAKARAHFPEGSRGQRLFSAYLRYVERLPGPDHEDLLLAARDRLREEAPPLKLLLVDGFHDFTPVQREILDLLAGAAEQTVVTLPLDPDRLTHPIFSTAARTAHALRGYEKEPLRGNRRTAGALRELERRLFTPAKATTPGKGIELLVCPTEEDEADRLARLVAASSRPYDDFLLVRRSFSDLHALYRAAFARHGVPLRFFGPEPFAGSPAARTAALWLRTLRGEVALVELFPLLRSPYFLNRPARKEADRLAAALREQSRPELPECVRPRAGGLVELLRAELGVRDALVQSPGGDEGIARAARLFALLEQEARAVADLPLAEGAEAVLRRLPLLKAAPHDRRHHCVHAVEVLDARQWEKPVAIVAGLSADAFPRQVRQDLFLRDEERRRLGEERDLHLPLRARREDEERYLFYVALTRARERLVLSYTAYNEQGTPRAPSPYLEEALAHFSDLERREIPLAEQYPQPRDAVSRRDLLPIVADGLVFGRPLAASLYALDAVPRSELAWPRRLALARARPLRDPPAAVALSPTAINAYRRCPYLLLMRLLNLRRPREEALDAMTRGNLVHQALEQCAADRMAGRTADAGAIFDRLFAAAAAGFRVGLTEEAHRRWMREAVIRAASRLRDAPVCAAERKFEIEVGGVTLRGRIDRLDRYPAGDLVRDYKTGHPSLKSALEFREVQLDAYLLAVERPAGAVYERVRRGDVAGFVVPELRDAAGDGDVEVLTREQIEERRATTRKLIAKVAAAVRGGRLAVSPEDPESCTRSQCDGFDLCRVARGRWLAKAARRVEEE